jgi:hypothetical protein
VVLRVFLVSALLTFGAADGRLEAVGQAGAGAGAAVTEPSVPPNSTINDFIPEDRPIGDCISAAPKPGCGSEARGGWRQGLVMLALVLGLAFVGWRIIAGVRRTSPSAEVEPGSADDSTDVGSRS